MNKIRGIYAASLSILDENLSLNIDKTIQHAENLISQGCHGVVVFGSTGQAQLISVSEKISLLNKLSQSKNKDNFLIGTGSNSLKENIHLMKHSIANGIDRFLLMPPAYYKNSDEGAYSFYSDVIQKVPESKIILYNFSKLSLTEISDISNTELFGL